MVNVDATFDVLYITRRLQDDFGGVMPAELHLFSYLACVLWMYRGRALEDWGYSFVGTELGAPFSPEIDDGIAELGGRGVLVRAAARMQVSAIAEERLKQVEGLELNRERVECLSAACSCTSAFSLGMIGGALAQEPELKRARTVAMTRPLLERSGQSQLYAHFDALRKSLRRDDIDLRVPAVVWLSALYQSGDQEPEPRGDL